MGTWCVWLLLLTVVLFLPRVTDAREETGPFDGQWGPWTEWSSCSRSCGLGLAYRLRHCHSTGSFAGDKPNCPGSSKQHRVCNKHECPGGNHDYRSIECRKYNNNYYGGRRHDWEAFLNPYARCELACKSKQHQYYSRFQTTVEDGTTCKQDKEAVCLAGECLDVGCDGIVGSQTTVDRCGVCGGDSSTCRAISGIFTHRRFARQGYHHMTTIPAGACKINITEMALSRNYLALKTSRSSIINTDHRLQATGRYQGAGTLFDYRRRSGPDCPGVCIFADGPTTEPVEVQILYYDTNPGVMYHFTVPLGTAAEMMSLANASHSHHHRYHLSSSTNKDSVHLKPINHPSSHPEASSDDHHSRHQRPHQQQQTDDDNRDAVEDTNSHSPHLNKDDADDDVTKAALQDAPAVPREHISSLDTRFSSSGSWQRPLTSVSRHTESKGDGGGGGEPLVKPALIPRRATVASSPLYIPPEGEGEPIEYRHYYHIDSDDYRRLQKTAGFAAQGREGERDNAIEGGRGGGVGSQVLHKPNIIPATRDAHARWLAGNSNIDNSLDKEENIPLSFPASPGSFVWTISGFTPCSEPCGSGLQQTLVVCMKRDTRVVVIEENCNVGARPKPTVVECNTQPCSPRWTTEDWSECSVTCGNGLQTRTVECKQRLSRTRYLSVSADRCVDSKPPITQFCRQPPCFQWRVSNWTKCSADCGLGERTRAAMCVNGEGETVSHAKCSLDRPKTSEICDMGSCARGWYHTKWSRECSPACGTKSFKTRKVYCAAEDGSTLPGDRCPANQKPRTRKACRSTKPCGGKWFAGPWSQCNVTCGVNAWRTRDVVCMKRLGRRLLSMVSSDNCLKKERPPMQDLCSDLPPCPSEWFMTHWTQCSANCGTGTQTREVKCLNSTLQPSLDCVVEARPSEREPCNKQPCDDLHHATALNSTSLTYRLRYQETTHSPFSYQPVNNRHRSRPFMALQAAAPAEITLENKYISAMGDEEEQPDNHHKHHDISRHRTASPHGASNSSTTSSTSTAASSVAPSDNDAEPADIVDDKSCTDQPNSRWCMLASQARLCHYMHYRQRCCKTCSKHHH